MSAAHSPGIQLCERREAVRLATVEITEDKDSRMPAKKLTIGQAVDQCIQAATEEWFRQHAGLRSREEAAANGIKKITAVAERFPGGKLQVSITIVAYTIRETTNDYYRYSRNGNSGYVLNEKHPEPKN